MNSARKMERIRSIDDLPRLGFGKEMNFLPPWIIRIRWTSPTRAQRNNWPIFWEPVRAFILSTGYRLVYFTARDPKNGEEITRMYTVDKMKLKGCRRFKNMIDALEHAGITPITYVRKKHR